MAEQQVPQSREVLPSRLRWSEFWLIVECASFQMDRQQLAAKLHEVIGAYAKGQLTWAEYKNQSDAIHKQLETLEDELGQQV